MTADNCVKCFYCDGHLSPRHEHDHMPVPQRNGGTEVVSSCVNCHDLKDRVFLNAWDSALVEEAMGQAGPYGRILLAKVYAVMSDVEAIRAGLELGIEGAA